MTFGSSLTSCFFFFLSFYLRFDFQICATDVRLHRPLPVDRNDNREHSDRGGSFEKAHENADERRPHGHGSLRHVHASLPGSLAFLHVHLRESLQAVISGRGLLFVEHDERSHPGPLPHRLHLAHVSLGCAKVSLFDSLLLF